MIKGVMMVVFTVPDQEDTNVRMEADVWMRGFAEERDYVEALAMVQDSILEIQADYQKNGLVTNGVVRTLVSEEQKKN